jgi:hypothetical protein
MACTAQVPGWLVSESRDGIVLMRDMLLALAPASGIQKVVETRLSPSAAMIEPKAPKFGGGGGGEEIKRRLK